MAVRQDLLDATERDDTGVPARFRDPVRRTRTRQVPVVRSPSDPGGRRCGPCGPATEDSDVGDPGGTRDCAGPRQPHGIRHRDGARPARPLRGSGRFVLRSSAGGANAPGEMGGGLSSFR